MTDILERVTKVVNMHKVLSGRKAALEESLESSNRALEGVRTRHKEDLQRFQLNRGSVEVVKQLIERLSQKGIKKLEGLLTYGLNTIFIDREYLVWIEVKERGDVKTAELWLIETLENGNQRKCKLRDSVGGGVQVVVSLVLRTYFIMVLDLRRLIFMDETFTEVADEYLPGLFEFVNSTIKELGFKFLLITHDTRFVTYATKLYRIRKGVPREVIKGENDG